MRYLLPLHPTRINTPDSLIRLDDYVSFFPYDERVMAVSWDIETATLAQFEPPCLEDFYKLPILKKWPL